MSPPHLRLADEPPPTPVPEPDPSERIAILSSLVRRPTETSETKIVAIADAIVALSIRETQTAEYAGAIADTTQGLRDDLNAMRASVKEIGSDVADIKAALIVHDARLVRSVVAQVAPPRWNRAVKAAWLLFSAVALIVAGGFAQNPSPFIEALERWLK